MDLLECFFLFSFLRAAKKKGGGGVEYYAQRTEII